MTPGSEDKPPYATIDAQILADYFSSLGVALKCTLCLSQDLSVPEVRSSVGMSCGTPLGTYSNLFIMKSSYGTRANINCYALICENCGHVMTFRAEKVLEWRRRVMMEKDSRDN